MIFLGSGNQLDGPIASQSDGVEEPQGTDCDDSRAHRHLLLFCQVDLIGADLFGASCSGDLSKWRAKRLTWRT